MKFTAKENGFITQLPYGELHISGDENFGFRPFQLLVSSIAVCSAGVLKKVLQKMRIQFEDLVVSADAVRNEDEANRIEEIHLHFVIKGNNLSPEKIEKAMEVSHKNCAMAQSVKESIKIIRSFEIA